MRFWLSMMAVPELDQLVELAKHAEECGFYGVTYADHLIMPTNIETPYPYTADGKLFWPLEAPWPDPWITLALLGAETSTIHLATNIYLAALRDPFTVARAVSTTAAFSGGRVICGVSAGWLKEEYDAAGIDFPSRGRRLDEILAVCRRLWAGETFSHEGEFFQFDSVILRPVPPEPVPIWVGGKAGPALRRAAANDGWLGLPGTVDDNLEIVSRMHAMRRDMGRPVETFRPCVSLIEPLTQSACQRLKEGGIGDTISIPWFPTPWEVEAFVPEGSDISQLSVKKDAISRYAERVIAKNT
jgi:probable F420-dependent oxidoreductase